MSWEFWIEKELGFATGYDELLEHLSEEFKLRVKTRAREVVDKRQYLAEWFIKNKWKFNRYDTNEKFAKKIGVKTNASVIHLSNYRDVSNRLEDYKKNTKVLAKRLKNC